ADFTAAFSDVDNDSLNKIQITSLPANGTLQLSGGNVTLNQEILTANIPNLIFIPAADYNGNSSFTWNGSDGSNYAPTAATANLTINPVNDVPSFSNSGNQTLTTWTNTTQTVNNWANTFSFGPPDENSQTVADFLVNVTSGNTLFTTLADIANDGTLTYTPNGTPGTATVQVQLQDNGGVANGGIDTSAAATFNIIIPPPTVNLSVNTTTGTEAGTTAITITATAPGPVVGNQTLNLALSGTASNSDFSSTIPTQITIADRTTSGQITLNIANDFLDEGDETATFTISNPTAGILLGTTTTQTITITDDGIAGITIIPTTGLATTEAGGTDTFTVVLNTQPTADVTINLTSDNPAEGTVNQPSLTFTPANWNTAQTVTVTGVDDLVADGDIAYNIITAPATSTDVNYNGVDGADVVVSNSDNETPGITITPTSGLATTEAGGTATFTVVLNTQPTADVTINLTSDNTAEGTVNQTSLTFTPANWNTAQTVTVTGVDDLVADRDIAYNIITTPATSADANYNGMDGADVTVTNTDDDSPVDNNPPDSGSPETNDGLTTPSLP
ncbi:MAG TPA: calcium-binding protein, partial [Oscillatoriaceae cyanobacterium M33_DOE_052]|nr:calcium-binding protein [Oscillatoriaceae cyanobacterium M33_DOE_052]